MGRKVLFVHDGPMGVFNNQCFGIHYKNELVDRYLFFGEQVTFLTRQKQISLSETSKYSRIDHSAFRFTPFPNFKSLRTRYKRTEAQGIIHNAVEQHDVIIVRLPSAAGVMAFRQAKRLNKPVLVEFVACVFDALWNYDWRGKLLAHYKYWQYRRLMKRSTHTVYVTEKFLQSRYPTVNGKSIGCSDVELKEIDEKILEERLIHIEKSKDRERLTLATVAAVDVKYKGHTDVIDAISFLKDKGIIAQYKVIGQGDSGRLKSRAVMHGVQDQIEFTGPVPHLEIFNLLKDIDIYIQPSYVEGLPRAVIEAMSVGTPVIGSKVGGIPELINSHYAYPPGNIIELVSKLRTISKEQLKQEAIRNFNSAKEYGSGILNANRKLFYKEFLTDHSLESN